MNQKKPPDLKELLNCQEYRNFDIKKSLSVEIREWMIPLGNSEENGIKMSAVDRSYGR